MRCPPVRAAVPATLLLTLLALLAPAGAGAADGTLAGKASFRDKALEGARIELWADWQGGFRGTPEATALTAADGSFSVAAPASRYFVILRKGAGGADAPPVPGDLFAFYGGNPVSLAEGEAITIGINAGEVLDPGPPTLPGGTGIRGRVSADGAPVARARVTLYQDGETIFRGMGYASSLTTGDGSFAFNLEPGTYWVVARKRAGDDKLGPLAAGDLFAFAPANPVTVAAGAYTAIALDATAKQVKVLAGEQVVTLDGTVRGGETLIRGTVRDAAGQPVKGIYVGAYRDSMMIYKPDFISPLTGEDGTYTITLSGGGEYFVIARDTLGGPAERGDLLGRYAGNESHSVTVKDGEKAEGIDIVAEKVE